MDTNGLLEVIAERTLNTEQIVQNKSVQDSLSETLRLMARKEKLIRETTIMIKLDSMTTPTKVSEFIELKYCNVIQRPSASYWQDKDYVYVNFITKCEKDSFLDWITLNTDESEFKMRIQEANEDGDHLQRKPIRLMINNVRKVIKTEILQLALKRILEDDNSMINFHEGKANSITGARSIMFNTDANGFRKLFGALEGTIPYVNTSTSTKTRLFIKINCKPWTCRDCFSFGIHQCEGKLCANCGLNGHLTKDCKSKTKFCKNCKRKGHRAKDSHCPLYLAEVAKEVRKYCFPLEYFTDIELRYHMTKHIQFN